jgi:single-strand DNA-binding protein
MNRVDLLGRLTKDPNVSYKNDLCVSRFTLAVDRRTKDKGADFISCVAFGKMGEFVEKYAKKGVKFALSGRIQTGSYEKDGKKVYTTDVVAESIEFAESKKASGETEQETVSEEFMNVTEDDLEGLPFN